MARVVGFARDKWAGRGLSLMSGALPVLAFPEPGLWWLAYVGLVPLILLISTAPGMREAAVRGWAGGTGFLIGAHHWLFPKTGPFLVLAAGAMGLLWAAWGAAAFRLLAPRAAAGRRLAAIGLLPAGWVLIETIRSWEYLGGPFGLLGATQWNAPSMLSIAAVGGVWAVGYVVVAVNTCCAIALMSRPDARLRAMTLLVAVGCLALGPVVDVWQTSARADEVQIGIVQVGVTKDPVTRFDRGVALSHSLVKEDVDLVAWGEGSVGFDLHDHPGVLARLRALAGELGVPLLVNVDARRDEAEGILKSSVLVDAGGIVDRYDKMRLVPFGEYIPLRLLFGWLGSITDAADEDRSRGTELELMSAGTFELAPLICFESAFPDIGRAVARRADVVIYQSADTSFQESWAPEIHASLAAVRAAEIGRPVVHATLTGVSAAFDAEGKLLEWIPADRRGAFVVEVPLTGGGITPFVRFGPWVPVGSLLACGAVALRTLIANRHLVQDAVAVNE